VFWSQFKSTKKAMKRMPISAKAVLVSRNQKVLILQKTCGKFDLPGGKVERGEQLYKALRREIAEEVGLSVRKFDFMASWIKQTSGTQHPRLMLIFRAHLPHKSTKVPLELSDEHIWGSFLSAKKALKLNMDMGYKNAVASSLQHKLRL